MSNIAPRVALAATVANVSDLVVFGDFDDEAAASLDTALRALLADHAGAMREPESMRWREYRRRSPFCGEENPRSPGLSLAIAPDVDDRSAVIGTVTCGPAFAGAPGVVHGGVLSGLFDESIGWLTSAFARDTQHVTGRLSVRYRRPTPIGAELTLRAEVQRHSSRRMVVTATCSTDSGETASAEALMVAVR